MSRRRSPGEGGCWPYPTKAGERFRAAGPVLLADGTVKMVRKRGFMTKKDGQAWLADQQAAGRKGEYVDPSKQKLGAYCAEVIDGMRIGQQTKASYVKNLRNHIEPYPVAHVPLAQLTGQRLDRATTACSRSPAGRTTRQARDCRRGRCATSTRSFTACSARP